MKSIVIGCFGGFTPKKILEKLYYSVFTTILIIFRR